MDQDAAHPRVPKLLFAIYLRGSSRRSESSQHQSSVCNYLAALRAVTFTRWAVMKSSLLLALLLLSRFPLHAQSFSSTQYPLPIAGTSGGTTVERADLNSDGRPDLFFTAFGHGKVGVLLNQGNGTFAAPVSTFVPGVQAAKVADFNNDHKLDIVACVSQTSQNFELQIWLGDGNGHFVKAGMQVSDQCSPLAAGDFNGDGNFDVVTRVWQTTGNVITVHTGNGKGGFASDIVSSNLGSTTGSNPGQVCRFGSLTPGDFNRDRKVDLFTPEDCSAIFGFTGGLAILTNDGSGHFSYKRVANESAIFNTAVRDVNQDGWLDILVNNESEPGEPRQFLDQVRLYLRQSDGSYLPTTFYARAYSEQKPFNLSAMDAIDLDGDGLKDIVMLESDFSETETNIIVAHTLHIFYPSNNNYTAFKNTPRIPIDLAASLVEWADFDRDGRADLVLTGLDKATSSFATEVALNTDDNAPTCSVVSTPVPTIALCKPVIKEEGTITTPGPVLANISLERPVTLVKVYVDGANKFTGYEDLVNKPLDFSQGPHQITVVAWDKSGATGASANFIVNGRTPACEPSIADHAVKICTPTDSSTPSGPVRILAAISDPGKIAARVYVDGVSVLLTTNKQIDFSKSLAAGKHRLTIRAWDASLNFSSTINFEVKAMVIFQ